jgi:hyperosmotically inducible protein
MKNIRMMLYAASAVVLLASAAGCTKTTDNNVAQNATVSNSPAMPNANASSPNAATANPSPASPESPGISGLPETSAKSKPTPTAAGKPPERVIGSGGNDFYLFSKIHGEINQDEQLKNSNIVVNISDGVVTLNGTVATPEQKARAEQLAHGVEGVKGIKNQLRIAAGKSKS